MCNCDVMLDEEKLVIGKFIQLGFKLNGPSEWTVLAGVVQHEKEEEEEDRIAISLAHGSEEKTTRWDDAAVKLEGSLIDCRSTNKNNDHFNGGSVAGNISSRAHHHHQCTTVGKSTDGGGGGVRCISKVVALGAGTTCMPSSTFAAASGLRYQYVRDSHAEVVARRAFKAYLLKQIEIAEEKEEEGDGGGNHCESIFYTAPLSPGGGDGDGGEDMMNDDHHHHYQLRKGITFSMYISQAPCGHASMHCFLPRSDAVDDAGAVDGAVDDDPDAVDAARKKRKVDDVVVGRGHGDYNCQR